MSIASKYNHGTRFTYIMPENCGFRSLGSLIEDNGPGCVYTVRGMYVNHKSKYGDAPVVLIDDAFINLPKYLLDTCKQMLLDDEFIEAVNHEKVGFQIYTYTNKNSNALLYSVHWIDL